MGVHKTQTYWILKASWEQNIASYLSIQSGSIISSFAFCGEDLKIEMTRLPEFFTKSNKSQLLKIFNPTPSLTWILKKDALILDSSSDSEFPGCCYHYQNFIRICRWNLFRNCLVDIHIHLKLGVKYPIYHGTSKAIFKSQ